MPNIVKLTSCSNHRRGIPNHDINWKVARPPRLQSSLGFRFFRWKQPIIRDDIRLNAETPSGVQGNGIVREQAYIGGGIGSSELVGYANQLIIGLPEVQTISETAIVAVLRLDEEDDARALKTDDLVRIVQHFPKHGRCRAGAFADTIVAFGLEAVDLSQYRGRYDQSHFFECAPSRPVELLQRMALYEEVGVYKKVQNGIRHGSLCAFAMKRRGRLAARATQP